MSVYIFHNFYDRTAKIIWIFKFLNNIYFGLQGKQNKKMNKKVKESKASLPSQRNDDLEEDLSSSEVSV